MALFTKKLVKIGLVNDTTSEVTEGINEGDQIILEGQNFLSDGEKVIIVK